MYHFNNICLKKKLEGIVLYLFTNIYTKSIGYLVESPTPVYQHDHVILPTKGSALRWLECPGSLRWSPKTAQPGQGSLSTQ